MAWHGTRWFLLVIEGGIVGVVSVTIVPPRHIPAKAFPNWNVSFTRLWQSQLLADFQPVLGSNERHPCRIVDHTAPAFDDGEYIRNDLKRQQVMAQADLARPSMYVQKSEDLALDDRECLSLLQHFAFNIGERARAWQSLLPGFLAQLERKLSKEVKHTQLVVTGFHGESKTELSRVMAERFEMP